MGRVHQHRSIPQIARFTQKGERGLGLSQSQKAWGKKHRGRSSIVGLAGAKEKKDKGRGGEKLAAVPG